MCISLEGIGHYYVVINFSIAKITSNFVKIKYICTSVTPWITYDSQKCAVAGQVQPMLIKWFCSDKEASYHPSSFPY